MYTINGKYILSNKYEKVIEHLSNDEIINDTEEEVCDNVNPINFNIPKNYYDELAKCNITPEETFKSIDIINDKFKIFSNNKEKKVDDTVNINDINYLDYNYVNCAKNKLNQYYDELKSGILINTLENDNKNFLGMQFIDINYFILDGLRDFAYINELKISLYSETITFFPQDPTSINKLTHDDNEINYKLYKNNELYNTIEIKDQDLHYFEMSNIDNDNASDPEKYIKSDYSLLSNTDFINMAKNILINKSNTHKAFTVNYNDKLEIVDLIFKSTLENAYHNFNFPQVKEVFTMNENVIDAQNNIGNESKIFSEIPKNNLKYHKTLVEIGAFDISEPQSYFANKIREDKYGSYDDYGLEWKVINLNPNNNNSTSKKTRIENNDRYSYIDNSNNEWLVEKKLYDKCGNEINIDSKNIKVEIEKDKSNNNIYYFTIRNKTSDAFSADKWNEISRNNKIHIYFYTLKPQFNLIVENIDRNGLSNGWRHKNINNQMYLEIGNNSRIIFKIRDDIKFTLKSINFKYPFDSFDENNKEVSKPLIVVRTDKSDNNFLFTYNEETVPDTSYNESNLFINTSSIKINNPNYEDINFELDIYNDQGKEIKNVETVIKSDDMEIYPSWFKNDGKSLKFGNIYPPQYSLDIKATDEDNNITKKTIPIFIKFSNTDLVPHILTNKIIVNYNEYAEIFIETENKNGSHNIVHANIYLLKNGERHNASWFSTKFKTVIFNNPPVEYDKFLNIINYELQIEIENKIGKKRKKVIPVIFKHDNKEFIFDDVISKSINQIKNYPKDNIPFYKELLANLISSYKTMKDQSKLHFNRSERVNVPIDNIEIDLNLLNSYKDKLSEFNIGPYFDLLSKRIKNLNLNTEMVENPVKVVIPIDVELDNKLFSTFNIQKNLIENPDLNDLNKYQNLAKDIYSKYKNVSNKNKLNLENISDIDEPKESLKIDSNLKNLNNSIDTINENELVKGLIKSKDIDSDIDSIKLLLPITFDN